MLGAKCFWKRRAYACVAERRVLERAYFALSCCLQTEIMETHLERELLARMPSFAMDKFLICLQ